MASNSKKQRRIQNEIAGLEIKKRNGMVQAILAFVALAVLISIKLNLVAQGFEWANSIVANGAIFILALVAAGVAGIGTRNWQRARRAIESLKNQL